MNEATIDLALKGHRRDSLELWRVVASGEFGDPGVRAWLQTVAQRLLEADAVKPAKRRPDHIMKATGLHGGSDKNRPVRELISHLESMPNLGPKARGSKTKYLVEHLDAHGLGGDASDADLSKKIDRERKKL